VNFHWPFTRHTPEPVSDLPGRLHGQFTPSPKTRRTNSRKASVEAQLAVYVAKTTHKQRKADADRYWLLAQLQRSVARSIRGREAGNG